MARDENPDTYTRRWSLQRLALLTAGLSPAVASLFRGHRALAATPRCNTPQYGAPPGYYPAPPPPDPAEIAAMPPTVRPLPATRATIKYPRSWEKTSVELTGEGGWGPGTYPARAWTALYYLTPKTILLTAVSDPVHKLTYIVYGGHTFYVTDKFDVVACTLTKGALTIRRSLFQTSNASPDSIDDALTRFAEKVSDKQLRQEESNETRIDLTPNIPMQFWKPGGATTETQTIRSIYPTRDGIQLQLLSADGNTVGKFNIDFAAKTLVSSSVEPDPWKRNR
jgi:hypothetical protein